MFTSSIKLHIGKFHVFVENVDVKEQRNVLKSVMHVVLFIKKHDELLFCS